MGAIQKRSHESMYKTDQTNEANRLRANFCYRKVGRAISK